MSKLTDYYASNTFEGFDELSISTEEIVVLKTLNNLSYKNGYEYGASYNTNGFNEPFTSKEKNKVAIPNDVYIGEEIRLYHSHTNNTSFSREDLSLLLNPKIAKIVVITPLGAVFSVMRGNGLLPRREEFEEFTETIAAEVNIELMDRPGFYDWSETVRNNEAIKEQAFQIARNFNWIIEGGML